ncbi:MAG: hypothetical protein BRD50_07295 [Bacteroidetes bacterium SW_11_45_7]|nr:MAG: hypothetical protein BRD50_07295 [Bacteroidetes bacterium SW_11_45_7]
MKVSREIYQLVRSLTKAEKRYFKLYASLQSGNKNYLTLFDAIDKQAKRKEAHEEHDENEVIRELEGETFIDHLPVIKNYLYSLILKSLRSYRSEDSVDKNLRGTIQDIRFLHEKGLHKPAGRFLKKAKKTAQKHDKLLILIELISIEHDINIETLDRQALATNTEDNFQVIKDTLGKLDNLYEYKKLEADLILSNKHRLWSNEKEVQQTYQDIIEHPLLQDDSRALSQEAYLLYYLLHIVALYYSDQTAGHSGIEKIYHYNTKLLHLFTDAVLRNQMLAAQKLGKENDIWESFGILKNFPVKDRKLKKRALATAYMQGMYIHVVRGEFDEGQHMLNKVSKYLPGIQPYMNKDHELSIYFNGFQITFAKEQYHQALEWLKAITEDDEYTDTREDLRSFARILETIVYFELDDRERTLRSLRQLHRYFAGKGHLDQFEQLFTEFVKSLAQTRTDEELIVLFRMMRDRLDYLHSEPNHSRAFHYFDLQAWLTSKLEDRSFAAIIHEKAGHNVDKQTDQKSTSS